MLGWIRCVFTGHERSKRFARWQDTAYVSVCKNCGVKMYRTTDARRSWQVDRRQQLRIEQQRD